MVGVSLACTVGCGQSDSGDSEDLARAGHDFVEVEFQRAASEADDPFEGTATVELEMRYDDCYQEFYAANPNWAIDGEDGSIAFDEWTERLCTEDVGSRAACEVVEIEQYEASGSLRLRVTYDLQGPLDSRRLLFGPLPPSNTVNCAGGAIPAMVLEASRTRGLDADGATLWGIATVVPPSMAPGERVAVNASRE